MASESREELPSAATTTRARVAALVPALRAGRHAGDPAGALVPDRAGHGGALVQPRAGLLGLPGQHLVEVEPGADQAVVGVAGQVGPGQLEPHARRR